MPKSYSISAESIAEESARVGGDFDQFDISRVIKLDDLWRFKLRNASITRIIFPMNEPRIEVLNDVSHLNGAVRYAPNTPPQYLL